MKPALCNLQTRSSSAFMCICDIVPDEADASLSIPQQYYISTVTGWYDQSRSSAIRQEMRDHYKRALPVACGTYVADYDPNCDDANVSQHHTAQYSMGGVQLTPFHRANRCQTQHLQNF
jgi:hypothetical protein